MENWKKCWKVLKTRNFFSSDYGRFICALKNYEKLIRLSNRSEIGSIIYKYAVGISRLPRRLRDDQVDYSHLLNLSNKITHYHDQYIESISKKYTKNYFSKCNRRSTHSTGKYKKKHRGREKS